MIRKFIPSGRKQTHCIIFVRLPSDSRFSSLAVSTSSITAEINQIPNQPIRFWQNV